MERLHISWCLLGAVATPSGIEHLTESERVRFDEFRFEKRRHEWLLGRLAAKALVCRLLRQRFGISLPLGAVEIGSRPDGAPVALNAALTGALPFPQAARLPLELSISHSRGAALCAAFWRSGDPTAPRAIGVDLETIERRDAGLFDDYFTPAERRFCENGPASTRDDRSTLVWAGKEALLKATGIGLRIDTRAATCLPSDDDFPCLQLDPPGPWQPLALKCQAPLDTVVNEAAGCWLAQDGYVMTIVVIR